MAVSLRSIAVGKCYLFDPGSRVRRVVAILPTGFVEYVARLKPEEGYFSTLKHVVKMDHFARDAVREVPCDHQNPSSRSRRKNTDPISN